MTVSNADPPHRADHLAEQLEDVGEGKVGDVDIVRSCVQVVQKTTQRVGEVAMGQDDTLGRSLRFGDYEKGLSFNILMRTVLPLVYMMMAGVEGTGGIGSKWFSTKACLPRLITCKGLKVLRADEMW